MTRAPVTCAICSNNVVVPISRVNSSSRAKWREVRPRPDGAARTPYHSGTLSDIRLTASATFGLA